jgi:soluble lytic murein transglycosylase-like protein
VKEKLAIALLILPAVPVFAADPVSIWSERLLAEATRRAELAEQAVRDQAVVSKVSEPEDVVIERVPRSTPGDAPLPDRIRRILRDEGLPESLIALAQVESGMNPAALSPKGARGMWQLMPETARHFGLVVDARRDDRLDPIKSTLAAARYLKLLYSRWEDWNLAFAAYNAGPGAVERAAGGAESGSLAFFKRLPTETREYVPKVWREIYRLDASGFPNLEIQQ